MAKTPKKNGQAMRTPSKTKKNSTCPISKKKTRSKPKLEGKWPHAKYTSIEELENKIDEYFDIGVKQKTVLVGRGSNQRTVTVPVPTITGLVLYLGFCDRASFYDYGKNPKFSHTIKRAHTFIEQEYEGLLQVGNTIGAIFALKNLGWKDKVETEHGLSDDATEFFKEMGKKGDGLPIKT